MTLKAKIKDSLTIVIVCSSSPSFYQQKSNMHITEEDFVGKYDDSIYTQKYCQNLVTKVCPSSPLPRECKQYPEVLTSLQRRNTDKAAEDVAFAGMSPGERAAAEVAREHGLLSQAQIKRRLTSSNDKHRSWFS